MAESNRQQLHEAYELIKAHRKQDAMRILVGVLKQERDNADAWWLLANATDDPAKKRQALEQVLRVSPDHGAARRQLDQLGASGMTASSPPPVIQPVSPPPVTPANPPASRSPFSDDPFAVRPAATDSFARRAAADDPFGDPFAAPAASTDDDPFGDPFATPASRQLDNVDDPFAIPSARQAPRKAKNDDPFAEDRPFSGAVAQRKAKPQQKRGANPLVIVLAIIGILAIVGCGLVAITAIAGVSLFNTAVQTAMPGGTFQAAVQDLQIALTEVGGGTIFGDVTDKGAISVGQTIRATLEGDGFTNHGYILNGSAGQSVTIELSAVNNGFDTRLTLLGASGEAVAANDDIDLQNNNLNSRIQTRLPDSGSYTVVVSDVGFDGGEYELTVR